MRLLPNHPNPFNAETTIRFDLPAPGHVQMVIFNSLGQRVRTLLAEPRPAGSHELTWSGVDDAGRAVASGTYHLVLEVDGLRRVRPLLLLK